MAKIKQTTTDFDAFELSILERALKLYIAVTNIETEGLDRNDPDRWGGEEMASRAATLAARLNELVPNDGDR